MGKKKRALLVMLLFPLMLGACTYEGGVNGGFNIVSTSQEIEMGKRLSREVERRFPILYDREVTSYISKLGMAIVEVSDRRDIPYHFSVVDEKDVNAFALPGGYVYVNRGLILKADNEAELMGVIAHEVSHVVARHSAEQMSKQFGLQLLASLILGNNPAFWESQVVNLFGTAGMLAFSRADELEADALGIKYMYKAGYDPYAMVTLLEKLLEERKRDPSGLEIFFSTHPSVKDRISRGVSMISEMPGAEELKTDSQRFHRIQRVVDYPEDAG